MKLMYLSPPFHTGSVKTLHHLLSGNLACRYKGLDRWSAFDVGPHQQPIPGSDLAVFRTAIQSFKIAQSVGINTHFVQQLDDLTFEMHGFEIVQDRDLDPKERDVFLPLEFITRWRCAGRRWREFRDGKKFPVDYGFATNDLPVEGTPFPYPNHEWTTKWAPVDEEVTLAVALRMAGITEDEMDYIWAILDTMNGAINAVLAQAGLARLDCKNEVGRGPGGEFVVLDVFCTQHEDRIVPLDKLREGVIDHWSKEKPRQKLIDLGYKKALDEARAAGQPDPPYPDLDAAFLQEVGDDWRRVAEMYCSVEIN